MVVCKFFQQGYCRYGQSCRFDHIYGSKYTYHANPQAQVAPTQPTGSSDEHLVTQVNADVQSALRGGQWILSCYSPYKEQPNFPGISDLSPEEARLFIYEAKNNNNFEQAVTYINDVFKTTKQKYEQLLQPNANIINVLRSLYKGEVLNSPFTNTEQNQFGGGNTASSIFRSAVNQPAAQNTAASIFSQGQKSIFNSQPDQAKDLFSRANNPSIFAQSSPPSISFASNQGSSDAKSLFASAVSNTNTPFNTNHQVNPSSIFSSANQSIFGAPPSQTNTPFNQAPSSTQFGQGQSNAPFGDQNTSPFGQSQGATSPFGQPQSATSPFGQPQSTTSPFGQPQNATSPFSQGNNYQRSETPASIFGQANKQVDVSNDPGIYSTMEDLSETDLEAFKSGAFELGFVPELPPPYQLCTRAL